MKSISQRIFEASGKPSDLRKYKRTERKEMDLLKQEAEKRNINIEEKLTLQEIVLCDNEFDNDTEG